MNIQEIFNRVIATGLYGGPNSYMCHSLDNAMNADVVTEPEAYFAERKIKEYLKEVGESTMNGVLIEMEKPYRDGEAIEIYKDWANRPFDLTPAEGNEMNNLEQLQQLIEDDLSVAEYYIEPGYTKDNEDMPILLANWNNVPDALQDQLTEEGYSMEWSDEWLVCDSNGIVRTSPDSYSWTPSFRMLDTGEIITIEDDFEVWEEACQNTDYGSSITPIHSQFNLLEEGYTLYNDDEYEAGLHPGQNDDPETILREVLAKFPNASVLFQAASSQFYTSFNVYYREA